MFRRDVHTRMLCGIPVPAGRLTGGRSQRNYVFQEHLPGCSGTQGRARTVRQLIRARGLCHRPMYLSVYFSTAWMMSSGA